MMRVLIHGLILSHFIGDANASCASRPNGKEQRMIKGRPRVKHEKSFKERLADEAAHPAVTDQDRVAGKLGCNRTVLVDFS